MNMMLGTFGPLTPKKGQGPVNPIYGEAKPTGILKGGALNAGACPLSYYLPPLWGGLGWSKPMILKVKALKLGCGCVAPTIKLGCRVCVRGWINPTEIWARTTHHLVPKPLQMLLFKKFKMIAIVT